MAKVCILAPVHIYDDIRVFKKEAISLANAGFETVLYARIAAATEVEGVKVKPVRKYSNRFERIFLTMPTLFINALKEKAQVYHLHNPDTLPIGILLKLFGKKVIYDTHEDFQERILIREWIPSIFRKILSSIVVGGEYLAGRLFNKVIITQAQLADRIKNSLLLANAPIIMPFEKRSISKEADLIRLVYLGMINNYRGLTSMLEVLLIMNKTKKTRLWLIGGADIEGTIENAQAHEAWQYVDFLGFLPQKKAFEYVMRAHFGMLLLHDYVDYRNTSPNKIYEYMTFAVPFIATNFPRWQQQLAASNSGIFVDVKDPIAIAASIIAASNQTAHYQEMAKNGQHYIQEEFNWTMENKKLIGLYKELLN